MVVVPDLIKGGFIVGGKHGRGVASCRTADGWSAPAFVSVGGGSWDYKLASKVWTWSCCTRSMGRQLEPGLPVTLPLTGQGLPFSGQALRECELMSVINRGRQRADHQWVPVILSFLTVFNRTNLLLFSSQVFISSKPRPSSFGRGFIFQDCPCRVHHALGDD